MTLTPLMPMATAVWLVENTTLTFKQIADKNNIEVFYPSTIDDTTIEQVKNLEPDLIIVIAYGIILPSNFLKQLKVIQFYK